MNPVLSNLASNIQAQALNFIPRAYMLGKLKAQKKYGMVKPWGDRDNVNISLLLNRHAEELQKSMIRAEQQILEGQTLQHIIENFINRLSSWSWTLFPALTLGMASYVDDHRQIIGEAEQVDPNDIGIIWHVAGDNRVCSICSYLNGRWFNAKEAYDLSSKVHPGCRCPKFFDVGAQDEALVGQIPDYKPGTAQDIYRDLNVAGLSHARVRRARMASTAKPKPMRPVGV